MGTRLVMVDDDMLLSEIVAGSLRADGYEVMHFSEALPALEWLNLHRPDGLILDINLEGSHIDGYQFCALARRGGWTGKFYMTPLINPTVPILMLTGESSVENRLQGFDAGTDDYLTKPFDVRELKARLAVLLRRAADQNPMQMEIIRLRSMEIYPDSKKVVIGNQPLELTSTEYNLLHWLAQQPNTVHTRETLLQEVWGYALADDETRTVDVYVRRIRKKLTGTDCEDLIQTRYGGGYVLAP